MLIKKIYELKTLYYKVQQQFNNNVIKANNSLIFINNIKNSKSYVIYINNCNNNYYSFSSSILNFNTLFKLYIFNYINFKKKNHLIFLKKKEINKSNLPINDSKNLKIQLNKHYDKGINVIITSIIDKILYFQILKFKLIGRHYKIKKKKFLTFNKNLFILKCLLNLSHKLYWLNVSNNLLLKIKSKLGRILCFSINPLFNLKLVGYFFFQLRPQNFYTKKGIKYLNKIKFRRRGKGPVV